MSSHAAPPFAKQLKRALRSALLRVVAAGASWLPLRFAQSAGDALGGLAFLLAPGERRKALTSLARAFPELSDAERVAIARACFRHLGRCAMEVAVAPRLGARLEQLVDLSGAAPALRTALARGRGVVMVTGHVGNWELTGWAVARAGFPVHAVAKENVDPRLTRWMDRFRARGRVRSIWRGQPGAAKEILRVLRSGAMLVLLLDQDTSVQSVFVPFFGTLAATPRAAADLILRTGAAAVVAFARRGADGRYGFAAWELEVPRTGDQEADALALTARFAAETEAAIRRAPDQWVWMHQRWKSRP